ncbi:hypothetical protein P9112_014645 [Eukaryota sp. TZLM1-RC]
MCPVYDSQQPRSSMYNKGNTKVSLMKPVLIPEFVSHLVNYLVVFAITIIMSVETILLFYDFTICAFFTKTHPVAPFLLLYFEQFYSWSSYVVLIVI